MRKFLFTLLLFASVLFLDYLVLIAIGYSAFKCGAQDGFYCGFYCKFAVGLLISSIIGGTYFAKKLMHHVS